MERTIVIASNLLPLACVLFLGWSAAPVLFMIWIDLAFACVSLARTAFAAFRPLFVDPSGPHVGAQAAGIAVFIWATALPPAAIAAVGIVWIIEPQYPGGLIGALAAERGVILGIALQIALRAFQLIRRPARPPGEGQSQARGNVFDDAPPGRWSGQQRDERIKVLRPAFEDGYLIILFRAVALGVLAAAFYGFGRIGFMAFVILASLFTIYVELHENWFGTLLRRFQAGGSPR